MFIIFYGQDTFRSLDFLNKTKKSFQEKRDPQNLNTIVLDAKNCESNNILEQMLSTPFLAEKRMLIIKNLLSESEHKDFLKEIIKRIKNNNFSEKNDYIFWEETDKFKTKNAKTLFDILKKQTYSKFFDKLTNLELKNWIKNNIKENNIKIDNNALNYLFINTAGEDLWKINSILEQLHFYKKDEELKKEDIKLFLEEKIDDNIFNLIDNIFSQNKNTVYKMINKQYEQGKDSSYILAMIIRQIRIFIKIQDIYEKENNIDNNDLAKKIGEHPFVVKKSLNFTKKYTKKYLKNIYKKLLEIDIKTKTASNNPKILIDFFINSI